MADGKKNEDIKVIKNPLLRPNLLLEEISGISLIVPPVAQKTNLEDHASKSGDENPPLNEKNQGTDVKLQETLQFTDIPLDVSDSKENTIDSSQLDSSSQATKLNDSSLSFGLRSFIPSFVPLLVPPSFKSHSPVEPSISEHSSGSQALKKHNSPETIVPDLVTPPVVPNGNNPPPPNLFFRPPEVSHPLVLPTAQSVSAPPCVYTGPPPSSGTSPLPSSITPTLPPPTSGIKRVGNANPYTLKSASQRFPNSLKTAVVQPVNADGIPTFAPPTSLNTLAGPQIGTVPTNPPFQEIFKPTDTQNNSSDFSPESKTFVKSETPVGNNVPFVQTFTSAISKFVSPNNVSDDSNICIDYSSGQQKIVEVNSTSISNLPPLLTNQFQSGITATNDLKDSNSNILKQEPFHHQRFDSNIDFNSNPVSSVPVFPFFNQPEAVNNFVDQISSGVPHITHLATSTVCVSSITTALSSVAPSYNPITNAPTATATYPLFNLNIPAANPASPEVEKNPKPIPIAPVSELTSYNPADSSGNFQNFPINASIPVSSNPIHSETLVTPGTELFSNNSTETENSVLNSISHPVSNHSYSEEQVKSVSTSSNFGNFPPTANLNSSFQKSENPPFNSNLFNNIITDNQVNLPDFSTYNNPISSPDNQINQVNLNNQVNLTKSPLHNQIYRSSPNKVEYSTNPSEKYTSNNTEDHQLIQTDINTSQAQTLEIISSSDTHFSDSSYQQVFSSQQPNTENSNLLIDKQADVLDNTSRQTEKLIPVVQPIPTFSYFSSQASCLPPPLDQSFQPNKQQSSPKLPSSSFFKPIESPVPPRNSTPNSKPQSETFENTIPTFVNPIPSAPPIISFPPPNISGPPKFLASAVVKQQKIEAPTVPSSINEGSGEQLDLEELDQIPLEGSAVPLYNPDYLSRKKKEDIPEFNNSYRLNRGIKKPTYAPVPDLGVTEKKTYPSPSSPSNISVSSQEEMASIEAQRHGHRMSSTSPPLGNTSPSTSTTLDAYYNIAAPKYRPPYHHWFFKCGRNKKSPWTPFSMADSLNLEQVFTSSELNEETKVPTDGGRYDVEVLHRRKLSVYWDEPPGEVRRCSWFVKSLSDSRYTPYDENIAALLEDEYKIGCETNEWNRRVELADGEVIIFHSPSAIAHHVRSSSPDAWGSQPTLQQKPRVVKRGVDDFDIAKGEPKQVDHLLLMVHGVGKACDLRFRSLVEVVDDFRAISLQLVSSHFHSGVENGNVGRVEILPVEWHGALHTETINDRLSAITLPSIPRAREFTNETLLDILFYTSPVFCEKIVEAVGNELNRVFTLYKSRNPGFRGQVSLGGHSLGSLILFDILSHQKPVHRPMVSTQASLQEDEEEDEPVDELGFLQKSSKARLSRRMSYLTIGPGTGQPYTNYPQLLFRPKSFFALGSPIGMFVTVRGLESLGEDFKFPTCPAFFNIFHPNDPVAYRIEALIKPEMSTIPAVLIPHHKGRKRMHLELKETMAHVTAALKQKLVDSMKNTWNAVYHLALFNRRDNALQGDVNKVIEDEVLRDGYLDSDPPLGLVGEEGAGSDVKVGKLNGGRRVDYVLQEAPLETFNQYISAIRSHLVYWESEDTLLMILKEIYGSMGISPDTQVPQPILPFDLSGEAESYSEYTYSIGATPTQFVRK